MALHTLVCAVAFAALEGAAIVAPARCVHPGAGLHYQVGGGPGTAGAGCLHGHGSATDGLLLALLPLLAMYVGRHATRPTSPGLGHAVAWAGAVAVCTSSLCILGESCVLAGAAHAMYVAKRGVQAGTVLSVSLYFTLHRAPQVSTRGSMMEAACVMLVAVLLSCLVAAIQEATTVMMLWGLMAVSMALLAPPSCTYTPAPH